MWTTTEWNPVKEILQHVSVLSESGAKVISLGADGSLRIEFYDRTKPDHETDKDE